jgi:hypothetical protein
MRTNEEVIQEFIDTSEERAIEMLKKSENINPYVTILTKDNLGEIGHHQFSIPPMFLEGDEGKDFVRDILLVGFKNMLKENNKDILCVNWASEGWMYKGNKKSVENYRELPKTEVLLMTFDSEDSQVMSTYEIVRGKWNVGESGLDKGINLFEINGRVTTKRKGRMGNLFKD